MPADLTRQQLCAALSISESTVRRLELLGLPYTPVGRRAKRYDLAEGKAWLRKNESLLAPASRDPAIAQSASAANEFTVAYRKVKLRVMPS